jgi:tripartite-type tricarboxylate transporter receptor subunit TctC
MFKTMAGIDIQPVPYKGDAAIFPALITGEIQVAIVPMATTLPQVAAGTLRALAVAGGKRAAALPDVPTVAESGLVGFESSSWQGWFVPAGTPREIVAIIQRSAKAALAAPDMLERLRVTGNEAVGSAPEEFEQRFKTDLAKFAKIVREAHIPVQD